MESSIGEKIVITLLSLVMLTSVAMLTYQLFVVSPTDRVVEGSLRTF